MSFTTRSARSSEWKRAVFLLEIERRRTIPQSLRTVRWSDTAYWSQRHRHRDWADDVDYALRLAWWSGKYGHAKRLDGRSIPGALMRRRLLECIKDGRTPGEARRVIGWSGPAYWQARFRHPDWAAQIDALLWRRDT